jgi:hypothetical protein
MARTQDRAVRVARPAEESPLLPAIVRSAHARGDRVTVSGVGIFTLEALQAEQGDCLLIHYGPVEAPRFVVVDGGPGRATYSGHLLPRLQELQARWAPTRPLPLPLVVCSHIDNDHIGGIIELVEGVTPARSDTVSVGSLWHNSFRRLAPDADEDELRAALAQIPQRSHDLEATRSIGQGDRLYEQAKRAAIAVNDGFSGGLVVAPAGHVTVHEEGELTLTVLGPDRAALKALREKWRKAAATRGPEGLGAVIAGDDDDSIENLSSIVFLAEYGGRAMLMTGDARGDYILDGLRRARRLGPDGIDLDVLKVQHHGSSHSNSPDFFRQVRARNYVISANGEYDNPDRPTLQAIVDARGAGGYRIWLTNRGRPGSGLRRMLEAFRRANPKVDVVFRDDRKPSLKVDLGANVTY